MNKRRVSMIAVVALVTILFTVGCVSNSVYRKDLESTNQKISGVESGVEDNERRIADMATETDAKVAAVDAKAEKAVQVGNNALSKAEAASKAAEAAALGKLLWTVTLSDERVKFDFGEAALSDETMATLNELAAKIKAYNKAVYIEIEGHTDNIGPAEGNMKLGAERAAAVQRYLNEKSGIPLHAISVISYGEDKPVADNGTKEGRAANRRVVVRVLE